MAVTIISESYGPRKPFVVCTAASTDELADYVGLWAEGSEATISTTKYVLDRTKGWVEEGGGSSGGSLFVQIEYDSTEQKNKLDKTYADVLAAAKDGTPVLIRQIFDDSVTEYTFSSVEKSGGVDPAYTVYVLDYSGQQESYSSSSADGVLYKDA